MLKVLIADDEKKVCRLIQMLCDWEKLNMELVGFAYTGLDAIQMIEEKRPDILITDICMPGCDGIDVIKYARDREIMLEVMIISGYTDFKYAQSAIRYGVVEYILKPIKKQELNDTLVKLGDRCYQKKARMNASNRLLQYMEDDQQRRRWKFFFEQIVPSQVQIDPDIAQINERYGYHFKPGLFRILEIKLDCNENRRMDLSLDRVADRIEEKIRAAMTPCCTEIEICRDGMELYVICNYIEEETHLFRQSLRSALDQIVLKRFQLGQYLFTIGMGKAVNDLERLSDSLQGAQNAIKERLVEGCEKLLEPPEGNDYVDYSEEISKFNLKISRALELVDEKLVEDHVYELKQQMKNRKSLTGGALLNVIFSVGIHAITFALRSEYRDIVSDFVEKCDSCYDMDQLFELLNLRIISLIDNVKQQRVQEERKPVRQAKQYIMNHYTDPITLEMVADQVGFSSSYFSSVFKKETGIGFGDYLLQLRMEKAKELLRTTKVNIKDICLEVGYNDLKHFNCIFRKYTGLKPGEYRKLYG